MNLSLTIMFLIAFNNHCSCSCSCSCHLQFIQFVNQSLKWSMSACMNRAIPILQLRRSRCILSHAIKHFDLLFIEADIHVHRSNQVIRILLHVRDCEAAGELLIVFFVVRSDGERQAVALTTYFIMVKIIIMIITIMRTITIMIIMIMMIIMVIRK